MIRIEDILERAAKRYTVYASQSANRPELIEFLKTAYADQFNAAEYQNEKDIIERWEWANVKNPNIDGFQSSAWICRENISKRIVGHFGIIPISLKYRDNYYPAAWGRDLIVLPEFRNLGIGPFLVASVLRDVRDKAAIFLIAGVRDHVYHMYKNLGFTDMGHIPLYVRVNRAYPIIHAKIASRPIASFLGMLGDSAAKLFYMPAQIQRYIRRKSGNVYIEEITHFDGSFDKLWEEASASFDLIARRDREYLNWRFVDQPHRRYKIFKASDKDGGDAVGYVVLREGVSRGLRVGVVTDILASPDSNKDVMKSLADFAVSHFAKVNDIAFIRCDMLNKNVGLDLRKCAFIGIPSRDRLMFINIREGLDEAFFKERQHWFIDYSDSDLDLAGPKNV